MPTLVSQACGIPTDVFTTVGEHRSLSIKQGDDHIIEVRTALNLLNSTSGYSSPAGECLVRLPVRNGQPFVVVQSNGQVWWAARGTVGRIQTELVASVDIFRFADAKKLPNTPAPIREAMIGKAK
jgi:hypothetical protein